MVWKAARGVKIENDETNCPLFEVENFISQYIPKISNFFMSVFVGNCH
jgi:hypothetical protein